MNGHGPSGLTQKEGGREGGREGRNRQCALVIRGTCRWPRAGPGIRREGEGEGRRDGGTEGGRDVPCSVLFFSFAVHVDGLVQVPGVLGHVLAHLREREVGREGGSNVWKTRRTDPQEEGGVGGREEGRREAREVGGRTR